MMDPSAVRRILGDALGSSGLKSRSRRWYGEFPEVTWVVELDHLPYGQRLGIDIGLWIAALGGNKPQKATDCPVLVHVENLPLGSEVERSTIIQALDLSANLGDEDRSLLIQQIASQLADFVSSHGTIVTVRQAFADGTLRSAFVRKDARPILEG